MRDDDRSDKNFTPADRLAQRRAQQEQHLASAHEQIAAQTKAMERALFIILEAAPARLIEFGLTVADVRAMLVAILNEGPARLAEYGFTEERAEALLA